MPEVIGFAFFVLAFSFLAFMVGISVRLANGPKRRSRPELEDPRNRALSILNERYALGEISRDEYLEKRSFIE